MLKIIIIAVVICVFFYTYSAKVKSSHLVSLKDIEKKTVDGVISFNDIVGWFKNIKNLDMENDVPFMANPLQKECLKEKMQIIINVNITEGKKAILLGVYNQKENKLTSSCLLEADSFDEKTLDTFGNEPFVVLA